jgi:exopolysaccharide production protein ExoQ
MSPGIALFLCTCFVLFLLHLERKKMPKASSTLLLPTIWLLCIASKPVSTWFGNENSLYDQVFFSALLCLGLIILGLKQFDWIGLLKEHTSLMLLLGYMLVSLLWSDVPFISFKRWIRELTALVMACLIQTEQYPRQAMEKLLRRSAYILIPFSMLLIKYFPNYGVSYNWSGMQSWTGVALQKNGLGRLCCITAFYLIWTLVMQWQRRERPVFKYQKHIDVFILFLTFWLMKGPPGAYSATATAALAGGLVVFLILLWMKKREQHLGANAFILILALLICNGIATPLLGGATVNSFANNLGRDETLTGRTEIWAALVPHAMREALLGFGFGGFWTPIQHQTFSEGHNGYLDTILDLGFFGLLLLSIFLLSSCKRASRQLNDDFYWASFWICLLFVAVLHNTSETSFGTFSNQLTAVLLFLAVSSTAAKSFGFPGATCGVKKSWFLFKHPGPANILKTTCSPLAEERRLQLHGSSGSTKLGPVA